MAFSRALGRKGASGEGEPDERGGACSAALWRARMAEARAKEVDTVGRAKPVMIQGTMSNAGRACLQQGCRVLSRTACA